MPSDNSKSILSSLLRDRHVMVECPACNREFRLADAEAFHGDNLTPAAREFLKTRQDELAERRKHLADIRKKASGLATQKAVDVGFGKVVEKVAPMLPGFPFAPRDCRALFEPIDYVVFKGLSAGGAVEELRFADIKSGKARLKDHQRQIKEVVEAGRVEFKVI
jgi:predicted Holliday junction resolvase-like endonuclease